MRQTTIRLIHLACRQLGLDADTRHDLQLVATGKASLTEMTDLELGKVMDALQQRGFKAGFKGSASAGRRAPAPRADLRYVHVLWAKLGAAGKLQKPGRNGLNAFVRASFADTWGSIPLDIDALRDAGQINAVVQALKAWCRREGVTL